MLGTTFRWREARTLLNEISARASFQFGARADRAAGNWPRRSWRVPRIVPEGSGSASNGTRRVSLTLAVYAAWLFLALAILIKSGVLLGVEEAVLRHLHQYADPAINRVARAVCTSVTMLSVGMLLCFCCRRNWKNALFLLATVGGAAILANIVKRVMERSRPELWDAVYPRHNFSFPSGHATQSMAILVATLILLGPSRLRMPLIVCGVTYVSLVGLCRMYLGLHYPTDVLAGWALSLAWVCAVSLLCEFLAPKRVPADSGAYVGASHSSAAFAAETPDPAAASPAPPSSAVIGALAFITTQGMRQD